MERNYIETPIIPDSPKVVPNEVAHVYIPIATSDIPGLAKYAAKYFTVIDGRVVLSKEYLDETAKALNELKEYADEQLRLKLDLVSNPTGNNPEVYAVNVAGEQIMVPYSAEILPSVLVARDHNGRIFSAIPTRDDEVVNKKYADDELSNKVDKSVSGFRDSDIVYGADAFDQRTFRVTPYNHINSIPFRNSNGNFAVGPPENESEVVNKSYLDDALYPKAVREYNFDDFPRCIAINPKSERQISLLGTPHPAPDALVIRDLYSRFTVLDPTADAHPANKKYVDTQLANFDFIKIVDVLPSEGLPNRVYLVPKSDTQNSDLFDEYVWVNENWEWITTKQLEIDLTPYARKDWTQSELKTKLPERSSIGLKSQVYVIDKNGNNFIIPFSDTLLPESFMLRDTNGNVDVDTPRSSFHAANKKYVDATNKDTKEWVQTEIVRQHNYYYTYQGETAEVSEFYEPEIDNSLEDNVASLEDNEYLGGMTK